MPARDVVDRRAPGPSAPRWPGAARSAGCASPSSTPIRDRGAWHTAAGMLAPITELHYTETPLLRLNLDSLARYPAFVAELEAETGLDGRLPRMRRDRRGVGRAPTSPRCATCTRSPTASTSTRALLTGARAARARTGPRRRAARRPATRPGDHQVDPRLLHAALTAAAPARGVEFVASSAAVEIAGERVAGVRLADGTTDRGRARRARRRLLVGAGRRACPAGAGRRCVRSRGRRCGCGSPARPAAAAHPARHGQGLGRLPRAAQRRRGSWSAPRVEEAGFDQLPRAGAVYELLRDAQSLVPELGEAVLEEVSTGLRPGSPDNAPLVGPAARARAAARHRPLPQRHPAQPRSPPTAIAALITDGTLPDVVDAVRARAGSQEASR